MKSEKAKDFIIDRLSHTTRTLAPKAIMELEVCMKEAATLAEEEMKTKAIDVHREICDNFVAQGFKTMHGYVSTENKCCRLNDWESQLPNQPACDGDCLYMKNFINKLNE